MHNQYKSLLEKKAHIKSEFAQIKHGPINEKLFPFQRDCLEMLLKIGRGAAFLDTGLGKTILQCEWARHIPGKVLIIAPLAVASQTTKEAMKHLGMTIDYSKDGTVKSQWTITNYERLDRFDLSQFVGVVLDESSILKGQTSKTREFLCEQFKNTPYKLACTATPAPNDYTELGNHAEFLGVMSQQEMLMRWFLHDSANTGCKAFLGMGVFMGGLRIKTV
jgi:superfamily II DNA or RNA helicase